MADRPRGLIDHIVRVAGFGTAMYSRLPRAVPESSRLAAELDEFGARLAADERS
ncbi:hypothetical protein [Spongiactinospora sp. TRM90649]|uniref:hypothetical protein n=1 Tax=Spongiactinospora sp. TRM90649 TaxID=3031114 RepID=UPI0023F741B3|nr:hypothetical protein [Spongiactinospora sp. TRM90649]MDF5754696.1 hypothetical protein [Spongiactinospora sp. TRM90649]